MAVPLPDDVRELLDAPNYVHLATLRADGSPRNWVVWAGVEGDRILICTGEKPGRRGTCATIPGSRCRSPTWPTPSAMAASQGRLCFVIEVEKAGQRTLVFSRQPGDTPPSAGGAAERGRGT